MKIQAISTNSFKGLFTDKSKENGGNWRMEYSPYCWENYFKSKMEPKKQLDMYSSVLPNNEEIFVRTSNYPIVESSKDILGTESYCRRSDGTMRRTITEMPAMNREESLRVVDKKLEKFLQLKKDIKKELENDIDKAKSDFNSASSNYNGCSNDYERGYWDRFDSKETNKSFMDRHKKQMVNSNDNIIEKFNLYKKLINSIDAIRERKEEGREEIQKIVELRKSGLLIDISKRDVVNPNEALVAAIQNIKANANKLICLPNKLITMEKIIKEFGEKGNSSEIIKFVEGIATGWILR